MLSDYRQCHRALIQWIEEITAQQELMKPGQAEDSRVLSEQLSQQTVRWERGASDSELTALTTAAFAKIPSSLSLRT